MARSGVASFAAVLLFLAGVASAEPVRVFSANPHYFARLRAFVEHAARKGIVVEVAFFNGMFRTRLLTHSEDFPLDGAR